MEKWKAEGGDEAIKAAKKQAKKDKRESKKASSPKKPVEVKPSTAGTGANFKSKEYIESSEDSSD